jgi:hypothetical protein
MPLVIKVQPDKQPQEIRPERGGVPSPEAVEQSVRKMNYLSQLFYEVDIGGWRSVVLTDYIPRKNTVKPELSFLLVRMLPLIPTPFMPEIEGVLSISLPSLQTHQATWVREGLPSLTIGFKCGTEAAEAALKQRLAEAAGYRYRRHGLVNPDEIIYY